jgi:environmental stress-induced protein Ves
VSPEGFSDTLPAVDGRAAASGLRVVRAAGLREIAWKNGGGVTREIAIHPEGAGMDDFLWRASAADIDAPGPFSRWEGFDRVLFVTRGGPVRLAREDTGQSVVLSAGQGFCFAGETPYRCDELSGGPVRDFNLMLRRSRALGRVQAWRGSLVRHLAPGHWLCHGYRGTYEFEISDRSGRDVLEAGDTAHLSVASGEHPILRMVPRSNDAGLIIAWIEAA